MTGKIKITNSDGVCSSTSVFHADGSEIRGVKLIDVQFRPNDMVKATVDFELIATDIEAEPLLSFETVRAAAMHYGYKLVDEDGLSPSAPPGDGEVNETFETLVKHYWVSLNNRDLHELTTDRGRFEKEFSRLYKENNRRKAAERWRLTRPAVKAALYYVMACRDVMEGGGGDRKFKIIPC